MKKGSSENGGCLFCFRVDARVLLLAAKECNFIG